MPALQSIADAIAAKYAPGVIAPPATLEGIRSSSAYPPGQLDPQPCVLVFLDDASLKSADGSRIAVVDYLVRLYLDPVLAQDVARESAALIAWADKLINAHATGLQLGGLVASCITVGLKVGTLRYASVDYAGVECRVRVVTSEGWNPTA